MRSRVCRLLDLRDRVHLGLRDLVHGLGLVVHRPFSSGSLAATSCPCRLLAACSPAQASPLRLPLLPLLPVSHLAPSAAARAVQALVEEQLVSAVASPRVRSVRVKELRLYLCSPSALAWAQLVVALAWRPVQWPPPLMALTRPVVEGQPRRLRMEVRVCSTSQPASAAAVLVGPVAEELA